MSDRQATRCAWAKNERLILYHDTEWGIPLHDDRRLFEFLILEGAQAGLSWHTILQKREAFREAFDQFDPTRIAKYTNPKIQQLLKNAGIIRNRLKINSAISNAQAYLALRKEFGSFDEYIWQFVQKKPIKNRWKTHQDIPCSTKESDAMSKDLKRRGFSFVGTTICYAFMQATGMVNDHTIDCYRYKELA
ncbi:DNA-3-methyladenine glycosylase I [Candidatus Nitronereus thalassa]|uniref:DNA-3-methyladenine glycosylase I n=1 Tax=Candidatus Nitronereus thalassa TaxID=3020898 RepID=A0ABU3K3C4_9BACT|nr:DNA-3-methyladenine glycosylase I [Candidatus Nitronereus thalassa]MDT7040892.1 DNA-3-methyladenine glycosylase I [Candidatus Nitronereus thalassa]